MGVNCKEMLRVSFFQACQCHPETQIKLFLLSCRVADNMWLAFNQPRFTTRSLCFSFLCHFSFCLSWPHFQFITVYKRCQSIFTLVYHEWPVCSQGCHCLSGDEEWWRWPQKALYLTLFAPLMNWSMLPLFNHTWQICAMESELFKKHPSIQLARLPPTKNGRKYVFNNVEGLKGTYNSSIGKIWSDPL